MKKQIIYLVALVLGSSFSVNGQIKGMGLKRDNAGYAKTALIAKPLGFGANLPKSMSLKQYCPSIGDQGQTGTCTAWASTYYAATMEYAIQNNLTDPAEIAKIAFDPYYTYLNIISEEEEATKACADGTYPGDACALLYSYGSKRIAFDKFDCSSAEYAKSNKEEVCRIDYTNYVRLSTQNWDGEQEDEFDVMITAVCQTLVNKHPVIIGMELPEAFRNIGSDGKFTSNGDEESLGGHAMCVVGYDDNKYGGCFTIVNSWGPGWGDDGFLYVTYKDFYKYVWYTFALESEMKTFYATPGTIGGNCNNGYGMMKHNTKKMHGISEGIFENGKMVSGIYLNDSGNISSKETKMMEKFVAKNDYSQLIYKNGYPIGYVDPY